jgi:hypothetical protein
MNPLDILRTLAALGIEASVKGDKVRLVPGSLVPADLREGVRVNKAAIMGLLHERNAKSVRPRYRQAYAGDTAGDDELWEIELQVHEKGICLCYSHVLKDFIAFCRDDEAAREVPPGFVPWSAAEMNALFEDAQDAVSLSALGLIHEVKKAGGRIVDMRREPEVGSGT